MQSVVFTSEDLRLFCPVSGAKLDENWVIDSPALAFQVIDEIGELSFIRPDLQPKWDEVASENDDFQSQLEDFEASLPDSIVCFKIDDGLPGGYVRVAFDMSDKASQ